MDPVEILSSIADFLDARALPEVRSVVGRCEQRSSGVALSSLKLWKHPNYSNSLERNQSLSETVATSDRANVHLLDEWPGRAPLRNKSFVKILHISVSPACANLQSSTPSLGIHKRSSVAQEVLPILKFPSDFR